MTGASSGLAAFGAAASAAARALPVASTFTNALFALFDNRQHAQLYTDAANDLRTLIADSDAAFLQDPDNAGKTAKVHEMEKAIAVVVNRVETGRNNLAPSPDQALKAAKDLQDKIEEVAKIKPKIGNLRPAVTPKTIAANSGAVIRIDGSGLGAGGKVVVNGVEASQTSATDGTVWFILSGTAEGAQTVSFTNKFDKTGDARINIVRFDLDVQSCTLPDAVVSPAGGGVPDRMLLTVTGQGFARGEDGGRLVLRDSANAEVKTASAPVWISHTTWEVLVTKADRDKVAGIQVLNPSVAVSDLTTKQASATPETKKPDTPLKRTDCGK